MIIENYLNNNKERRAHWSKCQEVQCIKAPEWKEGGHISSLVLASGTMGSCALVSAGLRSVSSGPSPALVSGLSVDGNVPGGVGT